MRMLLICLAVSILFGLSQFTPYASSTQGIGPTPTPTLTPMPTPTLTERQQYYLDQNWIFEPSMLPTPTPWPRTLPCEVDKEYPNLERWIRIWTYWIEYYRRIEYHDVPLEIALAVIMHESRGSPDARGCAGEIGLFQVLACDAVLPLPNGCVESDRVTFSGNYPTSILLKPIKNIRIGIDHLEDYTWQARAYFEGKNSPDYRTDQTIAVPEASELDWWFSDEGYVTVAMHQCGPMGYRRGHCGRLGGDVYAEDVLECWVPWVQRVLGLENYAIMKPWNHKILALHKSR